MQAEGLLLKVRRKRATHQPLSAPTERRNPLAVRETHRVPPSPQVPYDRLRSAVKARTKRVADEVAAAHDALTRKTSYAFALTRDDVGDADGARRDFLDALRETEERLLRLRRTLAEDSETERALVDRCEARVAHLRELPREDALEADPETTARRRAWESTRLDRMVVDYAIRRGDRQLAARVARETNVEHLVDIDAHLSGLDASAAMRRDGAYMPAIRWLDSVEDSPALRTEPETVFAAACLFRFFHCLELARSKRYAEALTYAREEALPKQISRWSSLSQLKKDGVAVWPELMLSLITTPFVDSSSSPRSTLFSAARRRENADSLDFIRMLEAGLPEESRLVAMMRAGLVALKKGTPPDHVNKEELTTEVRDDPLTHASLRELARPLPRARRATTRLVCRVTGEAMDEDNPPMALPNGQVYSANAIARMERGGRVYCPRTREGPFARDAIKKVFLA
jgi:macrophage erythroblast attacher